MEEQEQPQNEVQEEQNVQMEPTPLSSPPSHKKLIIGIVVVFVLVAGVAGAYFVLQLKPQPVDDVQTVSSAENVEPESTVNDIENTDISDWKTYINIKVGFSILYPPDYIVKENPDGIAVVGLFHKDGPIEATGLKIYSTETKLNSFSEYKGDLINNFEKQLEEDNLDLSKSSYSFKEESINNFQALLHKRDFYGLLGNIYNMEIWIGDGTILKFSSEDDNEILDKIYHSFKFIESQ